MSDFNIGQEAKELGYEAVAEILLDDQVWHDAKMFVQSVNTMDDPNLSKKENNDRKHQEVADKLLYIFGEIGQTLLDIAIKLAVLWLKNEMSKK